MARATREAFAGGQELQPWDWKSSITVTGWRVPAEEEATEEGEADGGMCVRSSFSFREELGGERKGLKTLWMKELMVGDFGDGFERLFWRCGL